MDYCIHSSKNVFRKLLWHMSYTLFVTPQLLNVIWRKFEGQMDNLLTRYFWRQIGN